jgi:hypothetical protein
MARKTRAIVAYFVGIGTYPEKSHCLTAPPGDVERMQEIVEAASKRSKIPCISHVLLDEKAKRADVIKGFEIFDDLRPDDICLFYYSGHGSRINAPYFLNQSGDLTESLVCQDSRTDHGEDLADKELAFLLKQTFGKQKTGVTLIMDCCHAGGNSRSVYVKNKMTEENPNLRAFERFLGHEHYQQHETADGVRYSIAPAGHIHLAACASEESAKEMEFDGISKSVFTHFLFESLTRENHKMSYAQLMNEVRLRAGQFVSFQTPELQTVGLDPLDKHRLFLDGAWQAPTTSYYLFQDRKLGWCLNAGQVDGVTENDFAMIEKKKDKFPVLESMVQKSRIGNAWDLDPTQMHPCLLKKETESRYCFAPVEWEETKFNDGMVAFLSNSKSKEFRFSVDPADATHFICKHDAQIVIVKKDDFDGLSDQPEKSIITQKIDPNDWGRTAYSLAHRLNQWAHYHRILNHRNPYSEIDFDAIALKVFVKTALKNGDKTPPEEKEIDQTITLPQFEIGGDIHCSELSLEVHNHSDIPLWASGLVLGSGWDDDLEATTDWSITNRFLQSERIEPGEFKTFLDHYEGQTLPFIPFYIWEDYARLIGNEAFSYLQIWVTTEPINTDRMNRKGVPINIKFFDRDRSIKKSLDPYEPDWQTFTIPLLIAKMT